MTVEQSINYSSGDVNHARPHLRSPVHQQQFLVIARSMLAKINTWDWPHDLGIASAIFSHTDSLHCPSSLRHAATVATSHYRVITASCCTSTERSEISFRHCIGERRRRLFEIPPSFCPSRVPSSSSGKRSTIFKMSAHQLWMTQNFHHMTRKANPPVSHNASATRGRLNEEMAIPI